jgi:hypothetical protein
VPALIVVVRRQIAQEGGVGEAVDRILGRRRGRAGWASASPPAVVSPEAAAPRDPE